MNKLKWIILFVFEVSVSYAQEKYWVFFKERDLSSSLAISEKTICNRELMGLPSFQESDFGPSIGLIQSLSNAGYRIHNKSRWFNAVSVYLYGSQIDSIKNLPFIQGIRKITNHQRIAVNNLQLEEDGIYLSYPLHQIKAAEFIEQGWLGEGVDIGVIDGGFYDAPKDPNLKYLFENNQVKSTKDFFNPPKVDFYGEKKSDGEVHGTMVTTAISGFNKEKRQLYGLAIKSNFYFARTESSEREARVEEDNWIAAVEWLDSLGVRLVNSSLGYATGFSNPDESYVPDQMDGQTSLIAKGARMAVNEKGMILVISAGNEGESKVWGGVVSTPGDVEEAISVGANDENGLRMAYSSKGVENVSFVKPDFTVYSQYGTSLAAPIVTGLVAGMLQNRPSLGSLEVKDLLRKSSGLGLVPNNFVGNGFPDAVKIVQLLEGKNLEYKKVVHKKAQRRYVLKTSQQDGVIVFHKKDTRNVLSQVLMKPEKGEVKIQRLLDAKKSTVVLEDKLIEITWKN